MGIGIADYSSSSSSSDSEGPVAKKDPNEIVRDRSRSQDKKSPKKGIFAENLTFQSSEKMLTRKRPTLEHLGAAAHILDWKISRISNLMDRNLKFRRAKISI